MSVPTGANFSIGIPRVSQGYPAGIPGKLILNHFGGCPQKNVYEEIQKRALSCFQFAITTIHVNRLSAPGPLAGTGEALVFYQRFFIQPLSFLLREIKHLL